MTKEEEELEVVNDQIEELKLSIKDAFNELAVKKIRLEYKLYEQSSRTIWKRRFVYAPTENSYYPSINLVDFFKEVDSSELLKNIQSAESWYNFLKETSNNFLVWASTKKPGGLTQEDTLKIPNFVKGTLGEYFSVNALRILRRLIINTKIYDFDCIMPYLNDDYGIDAVCLYDNGSGNVLPMVCQIKTWNPDSDYKINYTIANSCWSEGVRNKYIYDFAPLEKNTLVMWLGDKDHITVPLQQKTDLFNHMIFIDADTFDSQIGSNRTMFWNNIQDAIVSIKDL